MKRPKTAADIVVSPILDEDRTEAYTVLMHKRHDKLMEVLRHRIPEPIAEKLVAGDWRQSDNLYDEASVQLYAITHAMAQLKRAIIAVREVTP